MFRKALSVLLISCFAWFWPVGLTMAEISASPSLPANPVYQPPLRGAPDRRVGGGTRGGTLVLSVVAPKQSSWASQDQPQFYWYISAIPKQGKLTFSLNKASSSKPLFENTLLLPNNPGIQGYPLTGYRLEPRVEYLWSISLSFDEKEERADQVAKGGIIYNGLSDNDRLAWNKLKQDELIVLQSHSGYWYDAMENLMRLIDSHPNDSQYREWRKDLLMQVGLGNIAEF